MKDDTVSRAAVMQSLTREYNRRRTGDGLKLAWIEKAVDEVPAVQTCEDAVSRQQAIDAIERNAYRHTYIDQIVDIIKELPSAQPEIIRCKDCKHKHLENMVWTCPFGLPGGKNFFCGYGAEPYKGEQE